MASEREVEVERLLVELGALLKSWQGPTTLETERDCRNCSARQPRTPPCGKYELAADAELETRRRTMGKVRLYLEAASDQLDRAFENAEILGERMGL